MIINNTNFKRILYMIIATLTAICLCITPTYAAGRKLVSRSISGSFTWSAYRYTYSFNAVAGLTYNNSNNLTQISNLSFNNTSCKSSDASVPGSIIPTQTRKYYSGKTATYVVTVTRNAYGFYTDKVNYTLTYRSTDSGTPYSLDEEDQMILVEVTESAPYDIQILN